MGLFVDNFAGGGGASLGIKLATGREVDVAINHDAAAIAMHEANHPHTHHYCEDVWSVDPRAAGGDDVELAWFSPDCKHFSRAKGGKPVEKKILGVRADTPLPTTTARGTQNQLAAAYLVHMNHGDKQWSDAREPMRTVVSNNHCAEVRAFLIKYYGASTEGHNLREPLHTVTARDRFGLVTVAGVDYQIVDIGMRMLTPRELARAQGFPDSYLLTGTKCNQVARIGNSVCPPIAEAIVRANYHASRKAVVA